jgi:hypothetical protein
MLIVGALILRLAKTALINNFREQIEKSLIKPVEVSPFSGY